MATTRKAAPRKPIESEVCDPLEGYEAHDPFVFVVKGEQYEIPHLEDVPVAILAAVDLGNEAAVVDWLMHNTPAGDVVGDLPRFGFEKLVESWQKHSGIDLGESDGSQD